MTAHTIGLRRKFLTDEARLAYLLLTPAVIFLIVFMLYPIIYVLLMSLYQTDKIGRLKEFAGLINYIELFKTKEFWEVTVRSGIWTVIGVVTKTLLGMVIALILNVKYSGRKISRLLFIIPWASSVPISSMLWKWVYDHEFGLLNHSFKSSGIWANPPVWLGEPLPSFISCMWVDIWIGIPFMALIFLAGMQAIGDELYESASMDGVNSFQKFFYITLPGIKHLVLIASLLSALWTFNDFNVIYILTRGGPAGSTDILITSLYKSGFEWLKFSRASVMAIITFIILAVVSVVYAWIYFRQEKEMQ